MLQTFGIVYFSTTGLRTPPPIIDFKERVIVAPAGRPDDPDWDGVSDDAASEVQEAGEACSFNNKHWRRAKFPAHATSISFGGGPKVHMITI